VNTYALIDQTSGDVLGVYTATSAPIPAESATEFVAITGGSLPSGGGPGHRLRVQGGALVWQAVDAAQAWVAVREQRDRLLTETDWRVIRAVETATALPSAWADYRQALRDITQQADPLSITWPTPPN
jgi:hypothetical protein